MREGGRGMRAALQIGKKGPINRNTKSKQSKQRNSILNPSPPHLVDVPKRLTTNRMTVDTDMHMKTVIINSFI